MQIDDTKAAELQTFVQQATATLTKQAEVEAAISAEAEKTVDALIAAKALPETKRASMLAELKDPVLAQGVMRKLAGFYQKTRNENAELKKTAAEAPVADGATHSVRMAGEAADPALPTSFSKMQPSDRAYYKGLGFNVE